ncbi:hypothetical protein AAFH96_17120 [Polymorphospora sp. 2-325]|uniref:Uncharacterized protein n=1 Tax=Polymorphospora lycopeni TaxID=3140240 RepID=A0ABV5CS18_9ACTN
MTVYFRRTTEPEDKNGTRIAVKKADELGKFNYTFTLPSGAKPGDTYQVYLVSKNQQITSPVLTITK